MSKEKKLFPEIARGQTPCIQQTCVYAQNGTTVSVPVSTRTCEWVYMRTLHNMRQYTPVQTH